MKNLPERIYLNLGDGCFDDADFRDLSEVTWSEEKVNDTDVEYVRKSQWTSVDERLPEDDRLVLVRLNFNFGCSGYDIARYNKYWRCQLASRCGDGATISHWCEIPPLNPEKEER